MAVALISYNFLVTSINTRVTFSFTTTEPGERTGTFNQFIRPKGIVKLLNGLVKEERADLNPH